MKKIIMIITALAMCTSLCACSTFPENSGSSEDFTVSKSSDGYQTRYYNAGRVNNYGGMEFSGGGYEHEYPYPVNDLAELESRSDIIAVGKFVGNSVVCYERSKFSHILSKDTLDNIISYCPMEITQVFAGDVEVGDIVNVYQSEGEYDGGFYSKSLLTPMFDGDEWLFFLRKTPEEKSEHFNGYWCVDDNSGRYPTKNIDSNAQITLAKPEVEGVEFDGVKYGVYFKSDFKARLYKQIKEKYDI